MDREARQFLVRATFETSLLFVCKLASPVILFNTCNANGINTIGISTSRFRNEIPRCVKELRRFRQARVKEDSYSPILKGSVNPVRAREQRSTLSSISVEPLGTKQSKSIYSSPRFHGRNYRSAIVETGTARGAPFIEPPARGCHDITVVPVTRISGNFTRRGTPPALATKKRTVPCASVRGTRERRGTSRKEKMTGCH